MSQSVSKSQFKSKALEYFRQVETTGKSLVITDRGRPVLKLVPYAQAPTEVLSELRHSVVRYENPTEPVASEEWESMK